MKGCAVRARTRLEGGKGAGEAFPEQDRVQYSVISRQYDPLKLLEFCKFQFRSRKTDGWDTPEFLTLWQCRSPSTFPICEIAQNLGCILFFFFNAE